MEDGGRTGFDENIKKEYVMKKYLLAGLAWLGLSSVIWAGPIGLGLTSGIDFAGQSQLNEVAGVTPNLLVGYTGGLFADVNLSDSFSIQPEVNFTMKGQQFSTNANFIGTDTQSFHYLEFPLLLKGQISLTSFLKGYLLAGPSFAILLSETDTIYIAPSGSTPSVTTSVNDTNFYPNTDWGAIFGGGVEWQNFIFDIRYDWGLESAAPNFVIDRKAQLNGVLSFQLGYQIF